MSNEMAIDYGKWFLAEEIVRNHTPYNHGGFCLRPRCG